MQEREAPGREAGSTAPSERPVIVVADDDEAIRLLFRTALERAGLGVLLAANGRSAIDLARRNPVDVLLLDHNMPGLNGLDTLRELRADPQLRTIPVIMVTGSVMEADRVASLDQGADDVVVKPISVAELVARVRAQLPPVDPDRASTP